MSMSDPLTVPIKRNKATHRIELCIPALIKWAAGILATLLTASLIGGFGFLWSINASVAAMAQSDREMVRRMDRIEGKFDRTFTERDAIRMEERLRAEIERRHK